MATEEMPCIDPLVESTEGSGTSAGQLSSSTIVPETNEVANGSKSDEIQEPDEESRQLQENERTEQHTPSEVMDNFPKLGKIEAYTEQNLFETNSSVVKEEPVSQEVECDIPMAKTASSNQSVEVFNLESNACLATTTVTGNDDTHLNEYVAKSDLDNYLDGIVTPVPPARPLLRVKSEFAFPKTPQRESSPENEFFNTSNTVDREIFRPPPPLTFSSNSNSDFVADGIATPKLSLAAMNRLRVKAEFSLPPATHVDENIFDAKAQGRELGEVSPSISDDASEDEPIPPDFFDDLLHDKLKERVEEAQINDLEEKYSDRLKEFDRINKQLQGVVEKSNERSKKSKKQKKSKKKSRKRSRSRSLSPSSILKEKKLDNVTSHDRSKRSRISRLERQKPSSSKYVHSETAGENCLSAEVGFKIKSEFSANTLEHTARESSAISEDDEEIETPLTPNQKRERAITRARSLLDRLNQCSGNSPTIFSTFPFVSTVRKLPTSNSYVQQQMYENRSPLHTVNNVSYKFNSHTTRFNMEEWGLAALPPHSAKIAKLVGCDAEFIYNKLSTIKIPARLKKVKQEPNKEAENDEEEELIETTSSLYSNVMTQTDDVREFDIPLKPKGYEIAVQVEPSMYSIGCQTLETQSPTEDVHRDDDAPIMKIIRDLNENQLMAIHAFAELINEPNTNVNAMEMYKIQMKILDIYKMSQIPSAMITAQSPIVNNYTTLTTKNRDQPQLSIQSVKGADGKQFSVNDPRAKSASYSKRFVNDDAGSSSNYNSRYSTHSQYSHARSLTNDGHSQLPYSRPRGNEGRHLSSSSNYSPSSRQPRNTDCSNPATLTATKHYGRGAIRR